MERLFAGVSKFQNEVYPQKRELFEQLSNGQSPETLFITCADSRIVPDLITQANPGDLFICRNAGNMVPTYGEIQGGVSATIEYAVTVLRVRHVIVCGHTDCGVIKALMHPESVESLPTVKTWMQNGELARRIVNENHKDLTEDARVHALTAENVIAQLQHLRTHPSVAVRLARHDIFLHGWIYNIRSGAVDCFDEERRRFIPADEYRSRFAGTTLQRAV